ncbi:hypothetical protein [Halobacillus sp. H74]|uniref:hypothetical protein n=1 Tax=Halobacillus sp. H74 TaxID=3457436 RepID=UPI003FCD1AA4
MKKRKEEEIESLLKELPRVEDRQSKEDLYRSISPKLNKQKRKVAPWVLPTVASVAVVLLMAVFIPVFFGNMNPSTMEESSNDERAASESSSTEEEKEDTGQDSALLEDEEDHSDKGEESSKIQEVKPNDEEAVEEETVPPDEPDSQEGEAIQESTNLDSLIMASSEQPAPIVAHPGMNAEVIIPLAASSNNNIPFGAMGLSERVIEELEYDVNEEEQRATVTFPDQFTVNGSAWAKAIVDSIRWELEAYEVTTIEVQSESGAPVSLGNYGEVEELPVINEGEYYYKVYQYEDAAERFLVPIPAAQTISFKDALAKMKEKGDGLYVTPAVPDHVKFSSINENEGLVTIQIEHQAWASEQQLLTMVEAVLATAKQFGYEEVSFEGINVRRFSSYDLDNPIPVPSAVNPIR